MVRPGHRTHDPLPARAILPRDPARGTAQPEGTRGRYERGLVSQTPPHLQRHTRRCAATFLAGTGFCHVSPSRRGEETPPSTPGRHYLCALPRCLMAKVELRQNAFQFVHNEIGQFLGLIAVCTHTLIVPLVPFVFIFE